MDGANVSKRKLGGGRYKLCINTYCTSRISLTELSGSSWALLETSHSSPLLPPWGSRSWNQFSSLCHISSWASPSSTSSIHFIIGSLYSYPHPHTSHSHVHISTVFFLAHYIQFLLCPVFFQYTCTWIYAQLDFTSYRTCSLNLFPVS